MGGQPSRTRKLTLENEEPNLNLIKVSDEVVTRLRSGAEEVRRRNAAAQHYAAYPGVPVGPPPPFYHYEPSLTSLQIRQEAADKLKKNDDYWETRLLDLEKRHDQMKGVMEEEFKKAVDELQVKRLGKGPGVCEIPCVTKRKNVLACYKKYPNEPMRCAKEVQAFAACVDSRRITVVENVRCQVQA